MKTLKFLFSAVAILITMAASASEGNLNAVNADIQKELTTGNSFRIKKSEKVNVVFTTDSEGTVDLVIVNTTDDELKNAIIQKFCRMKFESLKAGVAYGVTLNFKLL